MVLPPGKYLIAVNIDVAMTLRVVGGLSPTLNSTLGANTIAVRYSVASAYGAMPTPTPTAWTTVTPSTTGVLYPVFLKWTE